MHPYEINVLGDSFLFFSFESEKRLDEALVLGKRCVILLPSLLADFRVIGYESNKKELYDYYSAAICAAAHLTEKRGLPLSDLSFETPNGIIEIFHTGVGLFTVNINKCKVLLSKSVELCACRLDACDVFVNGIFRVVGASSAKRFDDKLLPRLAGADFPLPCAAVVCSSERGRISLKRYSDYNPTPPSSVLTYAAAAYKEYAFLRRKESDAYFCFDDGSSCHVSRRGIEMTVKAKFVTEKNEFTGLAHLAVTENDS